MQDHVWEELGRIDYFLDQLARAVERGEVPAASYEALAPRYLERRAELVAILEIRAARSAPAAAAGGHAVAEAAAAGAHAAPATQPPRTSAPAPHAAGPTAPPAWAAPAAAPSSASTAHRMTPADEFFLEEGEGVAYPRVARTAGVPASAIPAHSAPRVERPMPVRPPREPVAVSTLLAYVGALLVIVAAAIFTVYNWESFSPTVKLAALLGVTVAFYGGGEGVRVGLKLPVIGVALLGVGSAMLLFDGWMLITALHLRGPMPWAWVLLTCSAVYCLIEVRVADRWFGLLAAVAQIAWWWLLGRGLGWEPLPTFAVLAAVALAWRLVGAWAPSEGAFKTLGMTLRVGGPLLAGVTVAGSLAAVALAVSTHSFGHAGLAEAAAVTLLAAIAVEHTRTARDLSVLAMLPLLAAAASLRSLTPAAWPVALGVMAAAAIACTAYALLARRGVYAAAAVLFSLASAALVPAGTTLDEALVTYALLSLMWLAVAEAVTRFAGPGRQQVGGVWAVASAIVAGGTAAVAMFTLSFGILAAPGHLQLARVVAVAVVCALVLERRRPGAGPSALALGPVLPAVFGVRFASAATWQTDVGVLVVLSLLCLAYALWRGGAGYAFAAVVLSVAAPLLGPSSGGLEVVVGLTGAIGVAWVAVSRVLRGVPGVAAGYARDAWEAGGTLVLAIATVSVPLACGAVPLSGLRISEAHAILAAAMPVAWALVYALSRKVPAGWAVYGTTGYATAALLAFAAPSWHSASYAMALMLLALAWSQLEPLPQRLLSLESEVVAFVSQALLAILPVGGLVATLVFFDTLRSWEVAGLLAVTSAVWLVEALRRRQTYAFALASGAAVVAAGQAAWVASGATRAPIAAGVTALAVATLAIALEWWRPKATVPVLTAVVAASAALPAALPASGDLALALVVLAMAWGVAGFAVRLPELAFPAGLLAAASGFAALDRFLATPLATILYATIVAMLLLAPTALVDRSAGDARTRAARALALVGACVLAFLVLLGMGGGLADAGTDWWHIGWQGLSAALALLGGYLLVWSTLEAAEGGMYAGIGLLVCAYWVLLLGRQVEQAELFLVAGALYAASMGYLWASRAPGRTVPPTCDAAAVLFGVIAPFALSLVSFDPSLSYRHALWALGLAAASTLAGLALRVRVYFLTGLAIAALDALWLSREMLFALPKWLLIGALGLAMMALGLAYARRQSVMGDAAERVRGALADWR